MKPVSFSKLAKLEIDRAAQWFENRKEGLGLEFYERVDEAAEKIERNPEGFRKVHLDYRRVALEQFKRVEPLVQDHAGWLTGNCMPVR